MSIFKAGQRTKNLNNIILEQVHSALKEDVGNGDLSVSALQDTLAKATVISHDTGVLAGTFWFDEVFKQLDPNVYVNWQLKDGNSIQSKQTLCTLEGNAKSLLTGERCALNFLQTLSATASSASQFSGYVRAGIKIMDTRKTLPGLRIAQKYAAICGGIVNNRLGLFDGILLKENHIKAYGSIEKAVRKTSHACPDIPIEIEVENIDEVREAIAAGAQIIMLDNFTLPQIREAVQLIDGTVEVEVSGNIIADDIDEIINAGIKRISIGAITKHISALDISMRFSV